MSEAKSRDGKMHKPPVFQTDKGLRFFAKCPSGDSANSFESVIGGGEIRLTGSMRL